MKKLLSVFLAVTMTFIMCVPAFAGVYIDALPEGPQKVLGGLLVEAIGDDKEKSDADIITYVVDKVDATALKKATLKDDVIAAVNAVFWDLDIKRDDAQPSNAAPALAAALTTELNKKIGTGLPGLPEFPKPDLDALLEAFKNVAGSIAGILGSLGDLIFGGGGETDTPTDPTDPDEEVCTCTCQCECTCEYCNGECACACEGLCPEGECTCCDQGETESIPETGDLALISVTSVALVAGIALVLTRKKKQA